MTADDYEGLGKAEARAKRSRSTKAPREQRRGLPTIKLRVGDLLDTVDAVERALIAADLGVFQRSNMVVGIGTAQVITADKKKVLQSEIIELGEHRIMELMMASANFEKWDERSKADVPANVPMTVVKAFQQRTGHYRLPVLSGIVSTPTLRDDGSLLTRPGYDADTGLYFDPAGATFPKIPEKPSREAARKALVVLDELIAGFPFKGKADRSVALSALLTSVMRRSLRTAPMHAFTAPVAGSGKSKLVDIANVIATGQEAGVVALGKDEAETEKRLSSLLLGGSSVAIDNAETGVGGDFLCQMLTQSTVRCRLLSTNKMPWMPTNVLVTATGNNVTLVGDMTRRTIVCRLDPGVERPELREFTFEPVERAKVERGRLVAAALTILRAYHIAGRPSQSSRLGSFEEWSDFIRGALIWLGQADPVQTMEQGRSLDPQLEAIRGVMLQWKAVIKSAVVSANEAALRAGDRAFQGDPHDFRHPEFREVLMTVAGRAGEVDPVRLGTWLGRNKERVVEGMQIKHVSTIAGIKRWAVSTGEQQKNGLWHGHDADELEGFV